MNKKRINLANFQNFRQIESFLECSALKVDQVIDVFCSAQQLVLHPTAPLVDVRKKVIQPKLARALRRKFLPCDLDKDNRLSDEELDLFQVKCFRKVIRHNVRKVFEERF